MPVQPKPWWESTTIWINVIGIVILFLQFALQQNFIVDKDVVGIILLGINILNRVRSAISPLTLTK